MGRDQLDAALLHAWHHGLSLRAVRVYQQGDDSGLGNDFAQQFKPLGSQLGVENAKAGQIAARPRETADQPVIDWVRANCRERRTVAAAGRDHVDFAANEVGGQNEQPLNMTLRPAIFGRHVLAFDVAGFLQSMSERS